MQLYNGWDESKGQPLHQPYVLDMLARVCACPGVAAAVSTTMGGEGMLGLTVVLYADKVGVVG